MKAQQAIDYILHNKAIKAHVTEQVKSGIDIDTAILAALKHNTELCGEMAMGETRRSKTAREKLIIDVYGVISTPSSVSISITERRGEMKTVEIMFDDLSGTKQGKLLIAAGIEDKEDMNWDIVPVAVVHFEEEDTGRLVDKTGKD